MTSLQKLFGRFDAAAKREGWMLDWGVGQDRIDATTEYNAAKSALLAMIIPPVDLDATNMRHAAALESCIPALENADFWNTKTIARLAAAYLQSLTTINPVSKLPQSPEMVHWERDSLLQSTEALQREIQRLKAVARGRLRKIRKLKHLPEASPDEQTEQPE